MALVRHENVEEAIYFAAFASREAADAETSRRSPTRKARSCLFERGRPLLGMLSPGSLTTCATGVRMNI